MSIETVTIRARGWLRTLRDAGAIGVFAVGLYLLGVLTVGVPDYLGVLAIQHGQVLLAGYTVAPGVAVVIGATIMMVGLGLCHRWIINDSGPVITHE